MFSESDHRFMTHALKLAEDCQIYARPNPGVGCVLVAGDRVVGEGATAPSGRPHAEVVALAAAGAAAAGAVAYVSLEPCCHQGASPPCTDALIEAGVREVVFAARDPNPVVGGRSSRLLEKGGIRVRRGLLETAASALNPGFMKRMLQGRPRVSLKMASSLDGAAAMASGESQWITGEAARFDVQALRASMGAIVTGAGTVLADDPKLTVRDPQFSALPAPPLRVVLDSRLRTSPAAQVYRSDGESLVYFTAAEGNFENSRAELQRIAAGDDGRPSLKAVLADLAAREINDLLVEAGGILSGQFLQQELVDEYIFYIAPKLLGDQTRCMFLTPGHRSLDEARNLEIVDVKWVGKDLRIRALPLPAS